MGIFRAGASTFTLTDTPVAVGAGGPGGSPGLGGSGDARASETGFAQPIAP